MEDNATALDLVFLRMQKMLFRGVLRIVRDSSAAEEITQEAYLRARKGLQSTLPNQLEAFLWQTARNLAIDHVRRRKVRSIVDLAGQQHADLADVADGRPSAEEHLIQKDNLRVLTEAMNKLPARAQRIWFLSRIEGWPYPRIAEHLGVSPNTVFNDVKMVMGVMLALKIKLDRS